MILPYRLVYTDHRRDAQLAAFSSFEDAEAVARVLGNFYGHAHLTDGQLVWDFPPAGTPATQETNIMNQFTFYLVLMDGRAWYGTAQAPDGNRCASLVMERALERGLLLPGAVPLRLEISGVRSKTFDMRPLGRVGPRADPVPHDGGK